MAALTRISVNPEVLVWARETAGLDENAAAARVGVSSRRIAEWEEGIQDPTIKQLRSLADAYHRPLAALFMAEPLRDERRERLPDYRRTQVRTQGTPRALQNAIMRARRQQDALREVAEELDAPVASQTANFSLEMSATADVSADILREVLGMDTIARATLSRPDEMLRALVRRTEDLQVTVIQVQRVAITDMRGFSLGDDTFPIVALNGADWPRGKLFTLLHELAHVGFDTSGLCDLAQEDDPEVERKCNEVAAAALMPRRPFIAAIPDSKTPLTLELARTLGNGFGASGEAAVLRMVNLGRATWDDYWRLKPEFDEAYAAYKTEEKEQSADKEAPIFYQLKARDLGRRFIQQVLSAYGEGALSSRDLVQLLEVSYDKVPRLAATIREEF